jgi:DNA invertase Pin-like site-specific DNA recombinase
LAKRPQGAKLLAAARPHDVILAAKLDRCFRSALDALTVIEDLKRRKVTLILLDIGDVTNGASELVLTIMAAVAQWERRAISERVADAKAQLRHEGRHQGGVRPFGWQFGAVTGKGQARDLIPDPAEQRAIKEILAMRRAGHTLMETRDAIRALGIKISHQTVSDIERRQGGAGG